MLDIFKAITRDIKLMLEQNSESHIIPSTESMMAVFNRISKEEYSKNSILLKPGGLAEYIYFIEKGSARVFYYKDSKDITDGFKGENTLVASVFSFICQKPDKRGIELLENSILWKMSYKDLEELTSKFPDLQYMYRMIMSNLLITTQNRLDRMLFQTAEERYLDFIESHPRANELLTLGMIASYLGITQETLSRIRSKK